jgi:chromosome segregation ATPase
MSTNDEMDLNTKILVEIRDEIRKTNERLDKTNERLDKTNERLEETNERMERGFGTLRTEIKDAARDVELRLSTRFTEFTNATQTVYEMLRDRFELRDRVEQCERDIAELKRRAG